MDNQERVVAWDRVLALARGCHDYMGGHTAEPEYGVYHHGIDTVINVLERAREQGDAPDMQIRIVEAIGAKALAEVARLTRILAVERGDWTQAPEGWEPRGADMWVRGARPGRAVIQRWHRDGQSTEWLRRGEIDGPRWPTALGAMGAIDVAEADDVAAELEVPHA